MVMAKFDFILSDLLQTAEFGRQLGNLAQPGDVICLNGDLGAGKTALTQKIAEGLDVPATSYVTSPSFAILQEYPGRIPLYHMDFYRLGDESEIADLGFEEYFYLSGLTVIEWSERGERFVPDHRLSVSLTIQPDLSRVAVLDFGTGTWKSRLAEFCRAVS